MVTFLEEENEDGSLYVSWRADCTTIFDEIRTQLKEAVPESRWIRERKSWLIPREYAFIYFSEIKQRYAEANPDEDPVPFSKTVILPHKDGTKLYIGLQAPPGLFFEATDVARMLNEGYLEQRLADVEKNRVVIVTSARLHKGQRADIPQADLLKVCDSQWASDRIKTIARQELAHRRTVMLRKKGYVYVIENQGLYKIGVTGHLANRLKGFKTSLPGGVRPICTTLVNNAVALETSLHEKFASKRINGEWFALTAEDIGWIRKKEWNGQKALQGN